MTPPAAAPSPRPPPGFTPGPDPSGTPRWSGGGKKFLWCILLVLAAHVGLLAFFGSNRPVVPREVTRDPRLQLAGPRDPLLALQNPALFALPNANDFTSARWAGRLPASEPSFRWSEPPRWLAPLATSPQLARGWTPPGPSRTLVPLNILPPPAPAAPPARLGGAMPAGSALVLPGSLAGRGLLTPLSLPSLTNDNLIPPSRVQVLVAPAGQIVSAVLLPATDSAEPMDRSDAADQQALALARRLRFAPAPRLVLAELDFCWHSVPENLNNAPAGP